jgi:hypothetical protein
MATVANTKVETRRDRLTYIDPRVDPQSRTAKIRVALANLDRWTYAQAMPTILGIGVAPLVQWVVLPPLIVWSALGMDVARSARSRGPMCGRSASW